MSIGCTEFSSVRWNPKDPEELLGCASLVMQALEKQFPIGTKASASADYAPFEAFIPKLQEWSAEATPFHNVQATHEVVRHLWHCHAFQEAAPRLRPFFDAFRALLTHLVPTLPVAALAGEVAVMRDALDRGEDPNGLLECPPLITMPPLFLAAFSGSQEAVSLLSDRGVSLYAQNGVEENLFHMALRGGDSVALLEHLYTKMEPRASTTLLRSPSRWWGTPLVYALAFRRKESVLWLLNKPTLLSTPDFCGDTALHHAYAWGDKEVLHAVEKRAQSLGIAKRLMAQRDASGFKPSEMDERVAQVKERRHTHLMNSPQISKKGGPVA